MHLTMGSVKFPGIFLLLLIAQKSVMSLEFGDDCVEGRDDACNHTLGLICRESKCQCFDDLRFVYSNGTCKTFTNADSWIEAPSFSRGMPCLDPLASQSSGGSDYCRCKPGFLPSQENAASLYVRCLPDDLIPTNVYCDETENLYCPPETGLLCSFDRCQCPHPRKQYLGYVDNYQRKCFNGPHLKNSCDPNSTSFNTDCGPNAVCGGEGKCLCKEGYITSFSLPLRCLAGYQQECGNEIYNMCNTDAGLICYRGTCLCGPDTFYDEEQKVCVVPEDYPCSHSTSYGPTNNFCASGLICRWQAPEINEFIGVCGKEHPK